MKIQLQDASLELTRARNLNEVLKVIGKMSASVKDLGREVKTLLTSLSRSGIISTSAELEIRRDGARRNTSKPLHQRLDKFVAPKPQQLAKHTNVLQELYHKKADLQLSLAVLRQNYGPAGKEAAAAIKTVKALLETVDDLISDALEGLGALANKHVPAEVSSLCNVVLNSFWKNVAAETHAEDGVSEMLYVAPVKDALHFSYYVEVDALTDSHGFVYDKFYIVLTGVIESSELTFYLNTLTTFQIPGAYPLGRPVELERDVDARMRILLAANDVLAETGRKAMPVTKPQLREINRLPGVASSTVEGSELRVKLASAATPESINKLLVKLLPVVQALVGPTRAKIKHKVERKGKAVTLVFILTSTPSARGVDAEALATLQAMLNIDDDEMEAIRSVLRGRK